MYSVLSNSRTVCLCMVYDGHKHVLYIRDCSPSVSPGPTARTLLELRQFARAVFKRCISST